MGFDTIEINLVFFLKVLTLSKALNIAGKVMLPCFVLVFSFFYWSYGLSHYFGWSLLQFGLP